MGVARTSPKVLVVGSGGREHAIVHTLARSPRGPILYAYPGNPGVLALARRLDAAEDSAEAIVEAARREGIGLVVVGPEAYLEQGIVDSCREAGIPAFGPTRSATRLETSKSFAKDVMDRAGVPTARYAVCRGLVEVREALERFGDRVAVKADGLAAGKGVLVTDSPEEALSFAADWLDTRAGERIVVEQALEGEEVSLFALVSGEVVIPFGLARDHKRAYDGDRGPNTGGMGAISPVDLPDDFMDDAISRIVRPVASEMARRGTPYQGVLYGGLMVTADGPCVIEFNARFGDPETQVLLPRLSTDLLDLIEATALGELDGVRVDLSEACACGVTVASAGYPVTRAGRRPVRVGAVPDGTILYHAGTVLGEDGALLASGGRVFTAVGLGSTMSEARRRAYELAQEVTFEGAWYRSDIGRRP